MRHRGELVSERRSDDGTAPPPETLDLAGEVCPYTFVRTKLRLEELPLGAELHILVDHAPAADNVPRSLRAEGQEVVSVVAIGGAEVPRWRIVTIKRAEPRLRNRSGNT
jgi:tRNA 2-thiouridine synthesizing protein A